MRSLAILPLLLSAIVPCRAQLYVGLEDASLAVKSSDLTGFPVVDWANHPAFEVNGMAVSPDGVLYICNGPFTTTGTRYNTPVKDLPMNIEVLTPAFLRDIGALDVRDALEYVSGIQLDTTTGTGGSRDNPENSTLLIRGISAGMKKDGFARFVLLV